jgi:hypothetical protein
VARLFLFPDGRLLWHMRLGEYDRAVPHVVATPVLLAYARRNRLRDLEAEIQQLVHDAVSHRGARD